jgi:drug/metabolite transporter (DMT)-like permease
MVARRQLLTRLRADLLLLVTAIIWGTAFIAQKTGMHGVGPFGFVGARFVLSLLVVTPLVLREARGKLPLARADGLAGLGLSVLFTSGVLLQQNGIRYTTVTNAGFLTGLYVVMVPFIAWALFRARPGPVVWVASLMALSGVWLLNGAQLSALGPGDLLVIACAVCFAAQVVLIGNLVKRTGRPMLFSAMQYALCALVGLAVGVGSEKLSLPSLQTCWVSIVYAGVVSGGIAYTLQAVAQQYTPASDAAIILSGEALFAALAGAVMLGDRLSLLGWAGCALILAAILMAEIGSTLMQRLRSV